MFVVELSADQTKTINTCEAWVEISSRCLKLTVSLWGAVTIETARERLIKPTPQAATSDPNLFWIDKTDVRWCCGWRRQSSLLHQIADKKTVAVFGRDAPGRGMWLAQVAKLG